MQHQTSNNPSPHPPSDAAAAAATLPAANGNHHTSDFATTSINSNENQLKRTRDRDHDPESSTSPDSHASANTPNTAATATTSDPTQHGPRDPKPKQKRNKPTLSCLECVERKTKCDRARPCLACLKRQSDCEYTAVANLIASADSRGKGSASSNGARGAGAKARFVARTPSKVRKIDGNASPGRRAVGVDVGEVVKGGGEGRDGPNLLTNVPYTKSSPSNVFGVGSQHPFSNYWTCAGGLPEVVGVMPSKEQADILIAKYFEVVDPVYPFMHRQTFYADYERFWALSPERKGDTDASFTALLFAMYALGTQFVQFPSYDERSQTAEFYCSAANQALRVYSYLNRTSMRAIQAMLLMACFLMNDNHASDAYAWAGIHLRQSYAMRLNRDPEIVVPEASVLEKQQRRKLWQAVFVQDTFLTVLLKLPPTATHSDVPVESLSEEAEMSTDGLDSGLLGAHSRVENLMSIAVIAPQTAEPIVPPAPHHTISAETMKSDVAYQRCMWRLGNLVQESLSSSYSLSLPLANSPRHKDSLVTTFRHLHQSFPAQFTELDYAALSARMLTTPRAVRQTLSLNSIYYHCLMLIHASENPAGGVECSLKPALEAAHEAIWSFFKLWGLFADDAGVWWVFQHRAFEESLLIAHLLSTRPVGEEMGEGTIFATAKEDVGRMLEHMERYGGNLEMHRTRKETLQEAFERIVV